LKYFILFEIVLADMLRLKEKYNKEVVSAIQEKFGYKNIMAVPKIEKVVVNVGFGKLCSGKTSNERREIQKAISSDLALITGQQPYLTKAKKSISSFKLRQGDFIGAMVTLRGQRMYDFLERLIHVGLPRSQDFRGISSRSIDQKGNLTIGIKEHIIFPEILPEKARIIFGFEVTVVTKAKTKEEGLELLKLLGFPIKP